jgi:anti-sigma regulatory factor (Ser/Thr protein kinase)/ketosteroid isomerase-like protein
MDRKLATLADPSALPKARSFVDAAAEDLGFDPQTRYQITMAVNEALSNAIEHGTPCGGGRLHLRVAAEEDGLAFYVRDCGEFAFTGSPGPDRIADRGRGFAFMNLLMDDVRLDARPGETVIRLAKRLSRARPEAGDRAFSPEANLAVIRSVFDAFDRWDVEALLERVDQGVIFEPLSTPVRGRTPYLGRDGLRSYFRDLQETWDEFKITMHDLRHRGQYVVALGRIRAVAGEFAADEPAGIVWRLRDGKVAWGKVYRTEEEALQAAGLLATW